MGGQEKHPWRASGHKGVLPTWRAQAPAVTGLEAGKAKLRARRGEIVAAGLREREKFGGEFHTHRVAAAVFFGGIAATIAEKAGEGLG